MNILSPISGVVWKLEVAVGDVVTAGQTLIILESMKMEIPIESERDGTVKEIQIKLEDFVQEDDILLRID